MSKTRQHQFPDALIAEIRTNRKWTPQSLMQPEEANFDLAIAINFYNTKTSQ